MNPRWLGVYSIGALILSAVLWWFMNGQMYIEGAYGPEYTLIDTDLSASLLLAAQVALFLCGIGFAIGACVKSTRKLISAALILLNLVVLVTGFLEVSHTIRTTDYAVLQKNQ